MSTGRSIHAVPSIPPPPREGIEDGPRLRGSSERPYGKFPTHPAAPRRPPTPPLGRRRPRNETRSQKGRQPDRGPRQNDRGRETLAQARNVAANLVPAPSRETKQRAEVNPSFCPSFEPQAAQTGSLMTRLFRRSEIFSASFMRGSGRLLAKRWLETVGVSNRDNFL